MDIYLKAFLIAIILSLLLTPLIKILAIKIGAVDKPNHRKIHTNLIPRLGGFAIYLSFVISVFLSFNYSNKSVKGLLLGSFIIVLCGVIDDIKELNYKTKLIFQFLATMALIIHNICITKISILSTDGTSFIDLGVLSIPVTLLWVIGVTNAMNLIDGLDGLACGLSSISSIFLFIIFIATGNNTMALMIIILAGACLGFLPYNFNPAKIFMGDTGSMFLGFILAGMSIQGTVKYAATIIMFAPILIIGLPLYDTLVTMLRRFIQGESIMSPDKQHFHHRMLSLGLTQKQVALISYLINTLLGLLAISVLFIEDISTNIIVSALIILTISIILENYVYTKNREQKNIEN